MTTDTSTPTAPTAEGPITTRATIGRWWSMLAGLVVVAVTIGIAELLAAISSWIGFSSTSTSSSPLQGLGSTFIYYTPEWLKHIAISVFGVYDKVALKTGMGLTLAVVAAILGLVASRRLQLARIGFLVLGAVVLMAIYTRAEGGLFDIVPTGLAVAAGFVLLTRLFEAAGVATGPTGSLDRRKFLTLLGGGAGLALASGGLSLLTPTSAGAEASQAQAAAEAADIVVIDKLPPVPAGATLDVNGISPFITANEDFYRIDTAFTVPRINAANWQLRIHGMVDKEITINYNDLLARPILERMVTLTCVSNEVGGGLISNAIWQGPLIRDLLAEAGVSADADMVMSRSDDGFSASTPLEVLTDQERDSIFAVTMNGEVLPFEHGFPVRMVVPGLYGFVSATKWVTSLEVSRFDQQTSYWTDRGWSPMGPIKTSSRIDVPASFQKVAAGKFAIGGVAWAPHRGIAKLEVKIDSGDWVEATLSEEVTVDSWRQWSYVYDAVPGQHTVTCRATDDTGAVQIEDIAAPIPDGSSGYDSTAFTVN